MANESKIATKWYINELKIATIYKPNLNLSTFPKKKTLSEKLISVKYLPLYVSLTEKLL